MHYLGYYLKWHPQSCYYYAVEHGGFQASPERTPGTYSKYNSIDDRIDDFHYYTTYIKFGIGRATYDAAQEIRSGDITREEGVALVKRFDGEFPERFAEEIFRYLSIDDACFPWRTPIRWSGYDPRELPGPGRYVSLSALWTELATSGNCATLCGWRMRGCARARGSSALNVVEVCPEAPLPMVPTFRKPVRAPCRPLAPTSDEIIGVGRSVGSR